MNLNELLHIEQVHLMRRQAARSSADIVAHRRALACVSRRLSELHYNHRPYSRPEGAA